MCPGGSFPPFFTMIQGFKNCKIVHICQPGQTPEATAQHMNAVPMPYSPTAEKHVQVTHLVFKHQQCAKKNTQPKTDWLTSRGWQRCLCNPSMSSNNATFCKQLLMGGGYKRGWGANKIYQTRSSTEFRCQHLGFGNKTMKQDLALIWEVNIWALPMQCTLSSQQTEKELSEHHKCNMQRQYKDHTQHSRNSLQGKHSWSCFALLASDGHLVAITLRHWLWRKYSN